MNLSDLGGNYQVISRPSAPIKDSNATIDSSSAALAQSQAALDKIQANKVFSTPLHNIAAGNSGDNVDTAIGAGKQALSDISMAGAQHAGPVGAGMLANAPEFAKNLGAFDSAMKPTNTPQATGAALTGVAELGVPVGAAKTTGALGKLGEVTGITKFLSERAAKKATDALASTAETMTKGEREAAILEDRLKPNLTGGGKYIASDTEKQAGQILSGKVGNNPIKNVPVIQNEIAQRGKEAEQFLGMNGRPITNEEDYQMFQDMKDKAAKYLTPEQMKNYDHTINQFQGELKGMGNLNTGTYYKALKNFEQNVTARLRQGNEALLTDSGSAQLQAAKDVRKSVRDMIGAKHPEFKDKMYDLASLYDALDNTVTKASKTDTFTKRFPAASKAIRYGIEAIGAGALYEGAKKAGAPLPL